MTHPQKVSYTRSVYQEFDEGGSLLMETVTRMNRPPIDVEVLASRFHDVYQKEAHRRGDVRHADRYEDLEESTKEWDRVLARYVLDYFTPSFQGDPPPA